MVLMASVEELDFIPIVAMVIVIRPVIAMVILILAIFLLLFLVIFILQLLLHCQEQYP